MKVIIKLLVKLLWKLGIIGWDDVANLLESLLGEEEEAAEETTTSAE